MEDIKELLFFLIENKYLSWSKNKLEFLFLSATVFFLTYNIIKKGIKSIFLFTNEMLANEELSPFYSKSEIRDATRNFIFTKCQNIDSSKFADPYDSHAFVARENMIPLFLKRAMSFNYTFNFDNIWILVLGDTGMGKTTFLINLLIYFKRRSFFSFKKKYIKIVPLAHPKAMEIIDSISEKAKDTILLLDALDEDVHAILNLESRLNTIIDKTLYFHRVILTSRTQFFSSENEEPYHTGVFKYGGDKGQQFFKKLYISPFDNDDIKNYLHKKFSVLQLGKRKKAKKIISEHAHLMSRPMLLSFLSDLLKSKKTFKYSFEVYEVLIEKWIERESSRYSKTEASIFRYNMYLFSLEVSTTIYESQKENISNIYISANAIENLAKGNNVKLSNLELKSRSLLNRTPEGQFKFAHKSFLEYFLAKKLFANKDFRVDFIYLKTYDNVKYFLSQMIWKTKEEILKKFPKITVDYIKFTGVLYLGIKLSHVSSDDFEDIELIFCEQEYESIFQNLICMCGKISKIKHLSIEYYLNQIDIAMKELQKEMEGTLHNPEHPDYRNDDIHRYESIVRDELFRSKDTISNHFERLLSWRDKNMVESKTITL